METNHPRCYLNNFKRYVRIIHPLKSMDNIYLNFLGILFINMVDMCIVQCAVIHKKVTFSLLLSKILIQGFQVLDSLFYRSHQYLFNTCFIFKSCHVATYLWQRFCVLLSFNTFSQAIKILMLFILFLKENCQKKFNCFLSFYPQRLTFSQAHIRS